MVRDDLVTFIEDRLCHTEDAEAVVSIVLDALIQRVPSVCPSGFDWTSGDIEDWLLAVKEGRA